MDADLLTVAPATTFTGNARIIRLLAVPLDLLYPLLVAHRLHLAEGNALALKPGRNLKS